MLEIENARSALAAMHIARTNGPETPPPITLSERWPLTIIQVAAIPHVTLPRAEIEACLGLKLPPSNSTSGNGTCTVLWIGPGSWLTVGERSARERLAADLDRAMGGAATVVDLSHARTVIRIAGPSAHTILAKGCAMDLEPHAMKPGTASVTALARLPVLIHAINERPTFDLYVYRSYAEHLWEWLSRSAAEYGRAVPTIGALSVPKTSSEVTR